MVNTQTLPGAIGTQFGMGWVKTPERVSTYKRRKVSNLGGFWYRIPFHDHALSRGWVHPLLRMNRNGVEKGGQMQMRKSWPRKQLNCSSLSFTPEIVLAANWPTYPSSHPLHFQSLHSVHTRKPSLNPDTTPKNENLRILRMFRLKILAQDRSIFTWGVNRAMKFNFVSSPCSDFWRFC